MKVARALLTGVILFSTASWSRDVEPQRAQTPPAADTAPDTSTIDNLFHELVQDAQYVNGLLRGVTDKESADKVAPKLREILSSMAKRLHSLESYPFTGEQDTEALKSNMAALTHVSQANLASMQRLAEVNAYGSEALMDIFVSYNIDKVSTTSLSEEDIPQSQLYSELTDALDHVLYTLRRVQDSTSAAESLPQLHTLLQQIESAHRRLALLAPPHTDDLRETLRPAREKLQQLSRELNAEIARLQAAKCYLCPELDALLPRLLSPAAS